jgi:hypothetical protein
VSAQINVNQTNQAAIPTNQDSVKIRRVQNGYVVDSHSEYEQGCPYSSALYVFETFAGLMAFLKKEFSIVTRN